MSLCAGHDTTDGVLSDKYGPAQEAGQDQQRAGHGEAGHYYTVLPNEVGHGLPTSQTGSAQTTSTDGVCLTEGCVKAGKLAAVGSRRCRTVCHTPFRVKQNPNSIDRESCAES